MVPATGGRDAPSTPERLARRLMARAHAVLSGAPPVASFGIALATLVLVGGIDYVLGYEISFSLFYLLPVGIATWYCGRGAGMAMAVLSCAVWFSADLLSHPLYSHQAIPVWNALVRFGFFAITSGLLATYKDALAAQRVLARTDPLTGLAGRRAFEETLAHDLALARRRNSPLTVAYLDLDEFKSVNDSRGHAEGDRVLRAVAEVLVRCLREADTPARIGGDEFVVALPDTDARGAEQLAAELLRELQKAFGAGRWPVGCSIGVVTVAVPGVSAASALEAADRAMYDAKRSGKGSIVCRNFGAA